MAGRDCRRHYLLKLVSGRCGDQDLARRAAGAFAKVILANGCRLSSPALCWHQSTKDKVFIEANPQNGLHKSFNDNRLPELLMTQGSCLLRHCSR